MTYVEYFGGFLIGFIMFAVFFFGFPWLTLIAGDIAAQMVKHWFNRTIIEDDNPNWFQLRYGTGLFLGVLVIWGVLGALGITGDGNEMPRGVYPILSVQTDPNPARPGSPGGGPPMRPHGILIPRPLRAVPSARLVRRLIPMVLRK